MTRNELRKQRRDAGLCAYCGREPLAPGSKWSCARCLTKATAKQRQRRRKVRADIDLRDVPRLDGNFLYCWW